MALDLKRYLSQERQARHRLKNAAPVPKQDTRLQAEAGSRRLVWLSSASIAVAVIAACLVWVR
jgi:hypothetical protein